MRVRWRRDEGGVFEGHTGLVLTGVLTGVGTLVCLVALTLVSIYLRKRYKRKHDTQNSQNSFNKIKERMSSENGHPILKSHFSHTPPVGGLVTSPTLQPSLHITDLHRQASTGYFHSLPSPAPFQSSTLIECRTLASQHSSLQQYSSSIPIATASPRRKAFQATEGHAHTTDRPSSYLPVPRGLTPLSMNFVRGKSSSPSASISSRPGFPTVPSSELIHPSQQGHHDAEEQGQEIICSPFQNKVTPDGTYFQNLERRQRIPSNTTIPNSASGTWDHSNSSHGPNSTKLNFSYPIPVMQAATASHGHSRSAGHVKDAYSSANVIRHLRNRSNGTIITYASSAFSNHSNATTKIQPVIFNDSPRSSFSVDHYQPNGQYITGHPSNRMQLTTRPRTQSTSRLRSTSTTLYNYESSPEIHQNYKFSALPSIVQDQRTSTNEESALPAPQSRQIDRRSTRRASGKLPDMLFSRTPSNEGPPEPISPVSLEDEDMATVEDESVLDPMDNLSRRRSQQLYADIRLSATSSVASFEGANETLKDTDSVRRPSLGYPKLSNTSLMTSTSSTATSTSYYGMAV